MTMHDGLPVAGYKSQPSAAVELVNANKRMEEEGLRMIENLAALGADPRWLALGRTQMEFAWMAINRAVFQPERAKLPGDGA